MFLKSEGRGGGPNDPTMGFAEIINLLYNSEPTGSAAVVENKTDGEDVSEKPPVYSNPLDHPLYECLLKYSFTETPGSDFEEGANTINTG